MQPDLYFLVSFFPFHSRYFNLFIFRWLYPHFFVSYIHVFHFTADKHPGFWDCFDPRFLGESKQVEQDPWPPFLQALMDSPVKWTPEEIVLRWMGGFSWMSGHED
jgi:hypothetical protein